VLEEGAAVTGVDLHVALAGGIGFATNAGVFASSANRHAERYASSRIFFIFDSGCWSRRRGFRAPLQNESRDGATADGLAITDRT